MGGVVQVGVDINAVVGSTWRAAPLPFVAGLGPRKAAALTRAVLQRRTINCRRDMWGQGGAGMLGSKVFRSTPPSPRHAATMLRHREWMPGFALRLAPRKQHQQERPAYAATAPE